ncbi:hypothetical protein O181_046633 [Austropuccinia psidii MF-1]|uniref:Uncharacterized protein n=1 Tax=Austropuccinia psidii MF-1 TaxID=1389203 RepID=A0A9Q3HIR2_9BASI|nr:hypothetical protein [Austropuccinia psidii MF-1]
MLYISIEDSHSTLDFATIIKSSIDKPYTRSVGPLGPFWPESNEAKRKKKGPSTSPEPQLGPHEPILTSNLNIPKNGQKDPRTQIGKEPHSGHFQPLASANHHRPPDQLQKDFPSIKGKDSPSPMSSIQRIQKNIHCHFFIVLEPSKQIITQARAQAVPTPTPRVLLDSTPAVPKLRAQLDRGPHWKGEAPSRKEGRGPGEDGEEEVKNSGEEEDSDGTEGAPAPVGASQDIGRPTLAQSNKPVSNQSEPSLLAIMQKMTQSMANIQAASSSE